MPRVFADTSYYVALLNKSDAHHAIATRLGSKLDREYTEWVTSHAVILELLAFFSRAGPESRSRAVELVVRLRQSAAVEIIDVSTPLLDAAVNLSDGGLTSNTAWRIAWVW